MDTTPAEIRTNSSPGWRYWLLAALSTSIGWGIRGNFGHEAGAMIAGVLGALAVGMLSGREDWLKDAPWFAAFGALGWSFGGSMSYGQVIAYTHSGDSASVLYGFACLYLIGFLWAAMGGAGVALPAFLSRRRLAEFIPPLFTVFALWYFWDQYQIRVIDVNPDFRQNDPFYWYDTDWMAALLAFVGVLTYAAVRRRWDRACSLILHLAAGWWAGFLILVVLLGIRMTPPRGDNWAGCLGMVVAMWVFLQRSGLRGVTHASVVSGVIGGLGFSGGILLKLIEITSGLKTNWHSVMEQTYGAVNGLAIAAALAYLIRRAPPADDYPGSQAANVSPPLTESDRSASTVILVFVFLIVPYLNIQKNVEEWVKRKTMPEVMYGIPAQNWFEVGFAALALAVVALLLRHRRNPLPAIPQSALGRAQLLYIAFLWIMVAANFDRAVVGFAPQRLITEGVIQLNAALCTFLALSTPPIIRRAAESVPDFRISLRRAGAIGFAVSVLAIVGQWAVVRAIYGDRFAGESGYHVRFGPNATTEKPLPGLPHP